MKSMRKSKYYGRWGGEKKLVQGVLKRHPDGFGFVIPDDSSHPDIYIPSGRIGSAMTNDRVEAAVQKKRGRGQRHFGSVEAILKRFREFAAGPYEILKGRQGALCSHSLSDSQTILLSNPKRIAVKKGDWVKARITSWPESGAPFAGEVEQNLGLIGSEAADDSKRVLAGRDISLEFPEEALKEADQIPPKAGPGDFSGRRDLRDKSFVTIDGAAAEDFDDAVYVEKRPFGFKLFVAIADVSHYVAESSALDREAFLRGNSSYLPGFCVPMLPEKLSSGICSLRPRAVRLALAEEMDFSPKGERLRSKFYPAVIESRRRLTYGEAQEMLDGFRPMEGLDFLRDAERLARILQKKTGKDGALDLDIPETVVTVGSGGEPTDILREPRLFTHKMIEQFMLAANIGASAFLEKRKIPLMYRVHEDPKEDKLQQLEIFARTLGFSKPLGSRKNLARFLSQFQDHSKKPLISKLVLRCLSQARYSAFNKGHYGLSFKSYTHFTSPIRRYCDLLIHRLIKSSLSAQASGRSPGQALSRVFGRASGGILGASRSASRKSAQKGKSKLRSPAEIEKIAAFISQREQNSVKAERQVKDIKKTRFLAERLGQNFSGVISSVTSFGLFVALDKFDVEGLVRLRDLPGQWIADEINMRAVGKRSGFTLKFGDKTEVQLAAARPLTGTLDFKLISHEGKALPQEPSEGRAAGRRRGRRKKPRREKPGREKPGREKPGREKPGREKSGAGGRPLSSAKAPKAENGGAKKRRGKKSAGAKAGRPGKKNRRARKTGQSAGKKRRRAGGRPRPRGKSR